MDTAEDRAHRTDARGAMLSWLALIALVALVAFGTGLHWGLPQAVNPDTVQPWALDTIAPIAPLNEAYHRFTRAGNEFVVYPLFQYMVLAAAYAPYVGFQLLTGGLSDPSATFPYGVSDVVAFCQDLTIVARLVSLAMALGIVAIIYRMTAEFASLRAARWAALGGALIAPLAYYAKTSNLDVPYAFWTVLAVWRFLHLLRDQRLRDYVLLGVFAALAVATKDQAYGFFLLIPIVMAWRNARSDGRATPGRLARALVAPPMLAAGAATLLTYALANNLFLGGLDGLLRHFAYGGEIYDHRQSTEAAFYTPSEQLALLAESTQILLAMLGPATLLLAVIGIVQCRRDGNGLLLYLLAFVGSYYLTVIVLFNMVFSRYLLVPALLLMPFVGVAAARITEARYRWRVAGIALVVLGFGTQAAFVTNLNLTLVADSRYRMAEWIYAHVPRGAVIESPVRERMLPHISADYRVRIVGNSEDPITMAENAEDLTAAALAERNPDYLLLLSGLGVTGDPAGWEDPALIAYYRDLLAGRLGYTLVADFATPHFLPYRQIPGTRPRSLLFARSTATDTASSH